MALAPHCPLGPIALAACMQVDIAAPNCASYTAQLVVVTDFCSRLFPSVCIQELSLQVSGHVSRNLDSYLSGGRCITMRGRIF